jgi:hypothetical protein
MDLKDNDKIDIHTNHSLTHKSLGDPSDHQLL